jgi:hypothetical protein
MAANTDYLVSVTTGPDRYFVSAWTMLTNQLFNLDEVLTK